MFYLFFLFFILYMKFELARSKKEERKKIKDYE